jgi:hypothetical protein
MSPSTEPGRGNRNRDPALAARIRRTALVLALLAVGVYIGFIVWTGLRHP